MTVRVIKLTYWCDNSGRYRGFARASIITDQFGGIVEIRATFLSLLIDALLPIAVCVVTVFVDRMPLEFYVYATSY